MTHILQLAVIQLMSLSADELLGGCGSDVEVLHGEVRVEVRGVTFFVLAVPRVAPPTTL